MDQATVEGSFRDPAGFVFLRDGRIHRQVNAVHAEHYDALMSSGLHEKLVNEGLLVAHTDLGVEAAAAEGAYTVIAPDVVPMISYPYEWCFSQLKDAALSTLRIQELALDHGMTLRDASAFNIQFLRGRPVLIDTLSFAKLEEGRPWVAYRQFCQHFLAPLAVMSYVDVRLGDLLLAQIDGLPLSLASALLPRRALLRPSLALHLGLHARSQRRHAGEQGREATFSLRSFRGLIESLRAAIGKLEWTPEETTWSSYYAEGSSYTAEGLEHKQSLVAAFLDESRPEIVWDLGANTGMFSRLAADRGAAVVAFDADRSCIEGAYRTLRQEGEKRILPLYMDLANPSPALGWHHAERDSFVDRGPADLVLALALVHHLAIGNNVPLDRIAAFFADLAPTLVIEFVPKGDPKVDLLLAAREDIFTDYTRAGFERAFSDRYAVERAEEIRDSSRVLYLLRRHS